MTLLKTAHLIDNTQMAHHMMRLSINDFPHGGFVIQATPFRNGLSDNFCHIYRMESYKI